MATQDSSRAKETDALLGKEESLTTKALVTAFFACLSGLLLGYDIGVTNGSLGPISSTFNLPDKEKEFYVGIMNILALPGCLWGGWLADCFGRRRAIMIGAFLFLIGNAMMTLARDYPHLVLGRSLTGFAVGITLVTEPLYTSEVAPARVRGMLTTNVEVSFNVGIVLGFAASWAFSFMPDEVSWRWMIGVCLWAPLVSILGMLLIVPESPRWLAMRGRFEEAEDALNDVLGPKEAEQAIRSLKALNQDHEVEELSWWEMLTSCPTAWFAIVGGGVAFFSQATGIETVMYYSGEILEEAGMTTEAMLGATTLMGCLKLASILISGQLVDVVGRKPLLLISSLGMGISMFFLGLSFRWHTGLYGKVVPITTFVLLFSFGFGPIVYTLNAEIYPTSCRSKGITLGMGIGRVMSALVSVSFLTLKDTMGLTGAFWLFSAMGLLGALFVIFCVTETKGMSLESRQEATESQRLSSKKAAFSA